MPSVQRRPTAAERARTVLASAGSVTVLWDDGRTDLTGACRDGGDGDVELVVRASSRLGQAALSAASEGEDLTVVLEFTDLAAAPARDRVRCRLTLGGWLSVVPAGGQPPAPAAVAEQFGEPFRTGAELRLRLDVAEIVVEDREGAFPVELDDYRDAAPDCLADGEATQLLHLAARHPDAVALLSRLAGPRLLQGAVRVLPLAIDRYGLVLRIERVRGHVDVRLPFRETLERSDGVGREVQFLLAEATRRSACTPLAADPAARPRD